MSEVIKTETVGDGDRKVEKIYALQGGSRADREAAGKALIDANKRGRYGVLVKLFPDKAASRVNGWSTTLVWWKDADQISVSHDNSPADRKWLMEQYR